MRRSAQARAEIYVAALNASLAGIPPERVRYHTCYGINHGPRIHEAALADVAGYMLRMNAGAYSFEAANARHEHEYHLWETVKLPDGQGADPRRDHPRDQHRRASRVDRRAAGAVRAPGRARERGGRRRLRLLLAGHLRPEVHPTVIWAKFEALREGARIASRKLWG